MKDYFIVILQGLAFVGLVVLAWAALLGGFFGTLWLLSLVNFGGGWTLAGILLVVAGVLIAILFILYIAKDILAWVKGEVYQRRLRRNRHGTN